MIRPSVACTHRDLEKFRIIADALSHKTRKTVSAFEVAGWYGEKYVTVKSNTELDKAVHKVDQMFADLIGPAEFGTAIYYGKLEPTIMKALDLQEIEPGHYISALEA